ncbi:MAG: [NiFe]-hydrogenase assembly chaperone HybE [Gammaproteobacteria bacterium]|nr:[NiFe]-hydrogenase assembly chaperone HybE [Gammaproteobacteria bacterium]
MMTETPQSNQQPSRVQHLQQRVTHIANNEMADLPLNRDGITVEALHFSRWQEGLLGILVTPWTMNLTYLPTVFQTQTQAIGTKQGYQFGDNHLEFITAYDEELGQYQVCSLESPIVSFSTQSEAQLIAKMIIDNLLNPQPASENTTKKSQQIISRRAFLRGKL